MSCQPPETSQALAGTAASLPAQPHQLTYDHVSNIDRLARYVFRYGANCRRLILDLADVEFFGVECFSTLNIIGDRCTTAAVAWTLIPSPAVARVLQISDPHRALLSQG